MIFLKKYQKIARDYFLFFYLYSVIHSFQYYTVIFWTLFPGVESGFSYFRIRNKSLCLYPPLHICYTCILFYPPVSCLTYQSNHNYIEISLFNIQETYCNLVTSTNLLSLCKYKSNFFFLQIYQNRHVNHIEKCRAVCCWRRFYVYLKVH